MAIQASLQLTNFDKNFDANIKKEIKTIIQKRIGNIITDIKSELSRELYNTIASSDTWIELQNGALRGELGLQTTQGLDQILITWAEGIEVKYEKNGELGVIKIGMIRSDYSDVLSLPEASYSYASSNTSGIIEWLRWLLLEGTSIIVSQYDFEASIQGRTGLGIMVRSGGGWQVPPQHAGTATDNFATRSLDSIQATIESVVKNAVKKGF